MSAITPAAVRICYDAARDVMAGGLRPTEAVDAAARDSGMTRSSALDYVYNLRHLVAGRRYTRTMNPEATALFLDWIAADYGDAVARGAARAVLLHCDYYAGLPRGGPQTAVRAVAEVVLARAPEGPVTPSDLVALELPDLAAALARSPAERRARLAAADPQPREIIARVRLFLRNPDVVAEVLARAAGACEACGAPAPFRRRSDGSPYLEVHHRVPLAEGGADRVENAAALCPNCHREAHHGALGTRFRTQAR